MIFNIGITGSRDGLVKSQKELVLTILTNLSNVYGTELIAHHGDCVGVDEEFHNMISQFTDKIVIHPPIVSELRAFCKTNYKIEEPLSYLLRNKEIVRQSDMLLVCPKERHEISRSGTWATYRFAKKTNKDYTLIIP